MEGNGVRSRLFATAVVVMLIAAAFATVGYAYTSSTENMGNTVTSEYVVLTQHEYTFSNENLRFDVIDTEGGKVYQLLGGYTELITIDGKKYYGVEVGHDTLTATRVGSEDTTVYVNVSSAHELGGWFTDYSDTLLDWRYILEVEDTSHVKQYAYYGGSLDGVWQYQTDGAPAEKLTLTAEEEYTTRLYFAGVGMNTSASLRSADSLLKITSSLSICPEWRPLSGTPNGLVKCTYKSGDGFGDDRVMYLKEGSDLILPDNMFTHDTEVFVGWKDSITGQTLMPSYVFKEVETDHEFVAQWASSGYVTITFNNGGGTGSMDYQYVLTDNTYTLPLCAFSKANYFEGWTVTATDGSPEKDYTTYKDPHTNINEIKENLTLTPSWGASNTKKVTVKDSGADKYLLDPDSDGSFTLSHCMLAPPVSLAYQGFEGWEFVGWSVWKNNTRTVAQSYTMPVGIDGYIIKNGTIKFAYDNGLENGQE